MSRERFLQQYDLIVDKDFEVDGKAAAWAAGFDGPRSWGQEDAVIKLEVDDPKKGNVSSSALVVSPDSRFLAAATNAVIRIYDVDTRQLHAELLGHLSNVYKLRFMPAQANGITPAKSTSYIVLSEGAKVSGRDGTIIVWHLDADGRSLTRTMPFAVDAMTDKALGAIEEDLTTHHVLPGPEIHLIRNDIAATLIKADTRNRVKHLQSVEGHFPSFGSEPISHDGIRFLYITHGETTQHGMRPADELPQIVICTFDGAEQCRLKGHTDAIMWAGWSPDDKVVATACWDASYKIWNAETGECRHTIANQGGQCWAGAFLPDGKHVLLSGGQPVKVAIYNVDTAEEVVKLEYEKLDHWMRYFTCHPQTNTIALANKRGIILWQPFGDSTGSEQKVEDIFKLHSDGSMLDNFISLSKLKWQDNGKKFLAKTSEGSLMIWDLSRNVKWRFQRPKGTPLDRSGGNDSMFYLAEKKLVVSLDGDGMLRFWRL